MNVNVNNSLGSLRLNNVFGKSNLSGAKGKFADIMAANAEKVRNDKYSRESSSPESTDEDYRYLSAKWDPNRMSKDEYEKFLDFLQDKGILSEDERAYLGGERVVTENSGSCYSPDYEIPIEFSDGNILEYRRYRASLIYEPKTAQTDWEVKVDKKIVSILERMARRW